MHTDSAPTSANNDAYTTMERESLLTKEETYSEPALVKELWQIMSKSQQQSSDRCIGYLLDSSNRRLEVYPVNTLTTLHEQQQQDGSEFTLRQLLSASKGDDLRLTLSDKLKVAVALAWAILQYSNTPWLADNWNEDDIRFIHRPGDSPRKIRTVPFLHRDFSSAVTDLRVPKPRMFYRIVRNENLFTLGVVLIELVYGKFIEELQLPGDEIDGVGLIFGTAQRILDEELEYEMGSEYVGAVRRCIRFDFNFQRSSLADEEVQKAVYQGVVLPLEHTLNMFMGLT